SPTATTTTTGATTWPANTSGSTPVQPKASTHSAPDPPHSKRAAPEGFATQTEPSKYQQLVHGSDLMARDTRGAGPGAPPGRGRSGTAPTTRGPGQAPTRARSRIAPGRTTRQATTRSSHD